MIKQQVQAPLPRGVTPLLTVLLLAHHHGTLTYVTAKLTTVEVLVVKLFVKAPPPQGQPTSPYP
jgi:hypothetical protein